MGAPIAEREVTVADPIYGTLTFHLNEAGPADAPAIVWLHGSGPGATAASNWEWQIGELSDAYRCLAPDIIGFGDSTHPDPPPMGLKAFTELRVRSLLALLDVLGVSSATFVGNSMGGIVTVALSLVAPERVERLVLMGTGGAPVPITPDLLKLILFYEDPTAEAMAELMTCFVHDAAFFGDDLAKIAAARMPRASRPEVERSHRATFGPGDPLAFTPEQVATITQPALVVHGTSDRIVSPVSGEWFAAHLPNARLELFADTGHWLQIERPRAFAELLRGFLRDTAG